MSDVLNQLQLSHPSFPVPDIYKRYKKITDKLRTAIVQNPKRLTMRKLKEEMEGRSSRSIQEAAVVDKPANLSCSKVWRERTKPMIVSIHIHCQRKQLLVNKDHYTKKAGSVRERRRSCRLYSLGESKEENDSFLCQIRVEQPAVKGSQIIVDSHYYSPNGVTNGVTMTTKRRSLRLRQQEVEKDRELLETNLSKRKTRSCSSNSEEDVKVMSVSVPPPKQPTEEVVMVMSTEALSQKNNEAGKRSLTYQVHSFPKFGQDVWCDLYRPKELHHVIGSQDALRQLHSWLSAWKEKCCGSGEGQLPSTVPPKPVEQATQQQDEGGSSALISLWKRGTMEDPDFEQTSRPRRKSCPLPLNESFDSSSSDCNGESELSPMMLVCGPIGCGKTSAVYACAEELGFKVCSISFTNLNLVTAKMLILPSASNLLTKPFCPS